MRIDRIALADLACGAAFLGSGGGGDPYHNQLLGEARIVQRGPFDLIGLDDLADDALVAPSGWIGAPTVSIEKLPNGARRRTACAVSNGSPAGRSMPCSRSRSAAETGLAPLLAAAEMGIPVVDADGMGRAFPESQMAIFSIHGLSACPSVLTACCGSTVTIEN